MKMFIDDCRTPVDYEEWVVVRNVKQAITEMKLCKNRGEVLEQVSYDHDMGESETTRKIIMWQSLHNCPPKRASIHSSNPVGREWIEKAMKNDFDHEIPIVEAPDFVV